ncbi:MAG TPA: hypothetical protein VJT16_11165 [Streptosporangiaceae bacterium]|jgi:hypothetical protein|nr:hypothetical protein [Streptosporangiaceae bacterium]
MDAQFASARDFILRQGRLLERRLYATRFEGAPATGVIDAIRGYRNDDGGFGHGLEPDKRCPASLPIDVEMALQALVTAGTRDEELVRGACDYLAKIAAAADSGGAVPLAFPVIEDYPRAEHWTDWTYVPSVNPTAGLVGLLHQLGARHPWVDEAAAWCWSQIESDRLPDDVHALSEVFGFLAHTPERDRAEVAAGRVREQLMSTSMFQLDPDAEGYGLSPLSIAPAADSRWRALFSEEVIAAHLDSMQRKQEPDGGWPISWEPPSEASRLEWRGIVTLGALRTLTSYGRLG